MRPVVDWDELISFIILFSSRKLLVFMLHRFYAGQPSNVAHRSKIGFPVDWNRYCMGGFRQFRMASSCWSWHEKKTCKHVNAIITKSRSHLGVPWGYSSYPLISYPESSGCLVSGATTHWPKNPRTLGKRLGKRQKFLAKANHVI